MTRCLTVAFVTLALLNRCGTAGSPPPAPASGTTPVTAAAQSPLVKTLSDPAIFGPDIGAVIRVLPAFAAAGENRVWVFTDRVAGTKKYPSLDEGKRAAKAISDRGERVMSPTLPLPPPRVHITALDGLRLRDDRAVHVAAQVAGAQFLAAGLHMDTVEQRLGKPERHEQILIDDGTERYPLVLELYYYQGGAIVFATREGTSDPRLVDRVIFDADRITAALF